MFVFPANTANRAAKEEAARARMAQVAADDNWNTRDKCKLLTLEHHMAAQRMGFQDLFEPLFKVDDFKTGLLDGRQSPNVAETESQKAEGADDADDLSEREAALAAFLEAPFSQVEPYAQYVSDKAPFGTHQGVKGLQFERVMVLMADDEARGFMFGYEKLLGAKAPSQTDRDHVEAGRETSIDRTRRLLYVTCSRAQKSLALVAYSDSPEAVQAYLIKNEWFTDGEIVLGL